MADRQFTAGALFAGIGGFCLGFSGAGIKTVWAVENDENAVKTYLKNINDVRVITHEDKPADIRNVKVINDDLEPVDVLHAGFPCQSFSIAGNRNGFNDERGKLFFEIIRIVNEFKDKKPSVIVLENSPNIKNGGDGAWFVEIKKELQRAGYWFRESNAQELDIYELTTLPQKRNRLFMVAFSRNHFKSGKFTFPHTHNTEDKSLSSLVGFDKALSDDYYYLDEHNRYYKMISNEVEDTSCIYQLRKYLVRVKERDVCPTLTANMGLGGHNVPFIHDQKGLRKLTEYECLKIQGFPDRFMFPDEVARSKRYMQVGNSVSVPVARLLAEQVRKKIIEDRKNG
ncbi:Modification methylase HpaII [Hydrogenovibrio crunogenus]|uniref:Cytosine-specific methyltransferase n=1 Tax=Hydrogenovibrio crunogenus TaxID=39765 RepID=A0A4P7NXS8_9GAMM|nr:Modification methylase HpaII [Hydrogenovibrio crunogenus]